MKDNQKTKKQLIDELDMLRQKVAALEIAGSQPVATGLRDASKAQQEDNAAKPKRKESRSFQEEKLNLVIEEAGLTSWDWDIEHDRKVFNVIWAEKLGYTLEEFNSSLQEFSLDYFQHPEDLPAAQQAMKDCLTGKTSIYRAEYRLRTKTGDWKWMLALGKIIERNAEGKPTLMAGVNLDISERKQAEEALRESEARFRRTFDQSPIGAAIVSLDYRFVRVNEALCCIMGYSEEELTSLGFADITHLDHLATDMEQVRRLEAGEIERYVTDKRYIRKDGSVVWGHLSVCIVKDTAGRSLYFLPMIEDITERKRAENALQLTQFTMDHAVDSIFWVRDDARFVYINDSACRHLGYSRQELLSMRVFDIDPNFSKEIWETHWKDLKQRGNTIIETTHRTKDGKEKLVEVAGNFMQFEGVTFNCAFIRDITERKRVEEQIHSSERELKKAQSVAHVGSWIWDIQNNKLTWSDEMYHIFGIAKGSFSDSLEEVIAQAIHPDDRQKVEQANISVIHDKKPVSLEYRVIWPDKTIRVVQQEDGELVLDETGSPSLITGIVQDITERKRAEEALRESEEKHRAVVERANDSIVILQDGIVIFSNPSFAAMLGYETGKVEGMGIPRFLPQESVGLMLERYQKRMAGEKLSTMVETELLHKSGRKLLVEVNGNVIQYKGKPADLVIMRDITERKRVEEALRQSEERFRTLVENIPGEVYRCLPTPPWRLIHNSAEIETITGYPASDFLEGSLLYSDFILSEDLEMVNSALEAGIACKKPFIIEYRIRHADGPIHWVAERGRAVYSEQGEPIWLDGVIFDITERKLAEETLKKSEARFRSYFELPIVGIAITSADKGWIEVNDRLCDMMGYTREELIQQKGWIELTHPEDLSADLDQFNRVLAGEIDGYSLDKRFIRKDGEIIWTSMSVRSVRLPDGSVDYFVVVVLDISERKRAEEALRQSEERFRTLVENIPGEVYRCLPTPPWRIIHNSAKIETINGYLVKDFLEGSLLYSDFILSEDLEMVNSALEAGIACKEPFSIEYRICHADGSIHWVSERGRAVYSEHGEPLWLDGVIFDITERKRAEEALRQAHERLQATLNALPDLMFEIDREGRFYDYRVTSKDLLYISPEVFLGKTVSQVLPKEAADIANKAIAEAVEKGRHRGATYSLETPAGLHWFELSIASKGDPKAPDGRLIVLAHDITERKRVEDALRESERSYRTLVENVPGAVYRCEPVPPWRTIHISSEIEVISGFPVRDFLDNTILFDNFEFPEDIEMVNGAILTGIADKKPYVIEYRVRHVDGSIRWLYEKGRAIYSEQGQPLWLDGVFLDITERKRAEEALREAQKLASMGSLAAGMAHEINSPLQVITGLSERITRQLESGQLDEGRLKRDIATVNHCGWNIANIVRSLLTYARESPGQVASHNLNEIVKDTLLLTEYQLKTWSNISILSDLGKNLPPLSCERTQIVQVLINLLTNARDAMPIGGKITIRTRYNAEHNRFKLQVSDTGTGIPKEMQTKIFDPFFTTKPVDQGTGLGLSIVFGIVKTHGGDIKVESAPKQGTTFTIYLPKEPIQKPDSEPLAENHGRY